MSDDASSPAEESNPSEPAEASAGASAEVLGGPTGTAMMNPRTLRIVRGLLAPVLVAGAVGVHFSVNVPEEKVVMPKKGKKKPKRPRRPKTASKERSAEQMDAAWERWSVEPYDGEPIKGKWGRRMQTAVNKAVVLARKDAFEGAPEDPRVVVTGTQCRTVRCRFTLRSPFEHEPGLVVESLRRQRYEGEPLWRTVESEPIEPPTEHSPKKDHYVQVTIGIRFDSLDTKAIEFAPSKDKPAAKADEETPKAEPKAAE